MKKRIASLLLAALLGTTILSAHNGHEKKSVSNPVKHTIQNLVHLPEQFKQLGFDEKVKVLFTVNSLGQVENVLCICANAELKTSVENQFQCMRFEESKENTLYTINISFKVL